MACGFNSVEMLYKSGQLSPRREISAKTKGCIRPLERGNPDIRRGGRKPHSPRIPTATDCRNTLQKQPNFSMNRP
jgi:hypothetical protein